MLDGPFSNVEACQQYDNARRKAQEELDNYVPSDTEDKEEDGTKRLDNTAEQIPHALPTLENDVTACLKCSIGCKNVDPTQQSSQALEVVQQLGPTPGLPGQPSNKRDTVLSVQQPLSAIKIATATTTGGLPSPPNRPNKRKVLMTEEEDGAERRTKRMRLQH
ncbi:hypothetical protein K469DRAFT_682080 [Zopfia rhizophila CBS 207.26]|uniref:Uncharacterized protein n=1 Tax=Zopfia rhizophila CBS 207.26 TaxID=1314779 RepID=A0A6A6F0D9_9PEZI|nr:hypothetical protein K469DRAFT_682080 [Zopfia rhizophila CBS 207.26]